MNNNDLNIIKQALEVIDRALEETPEKRLPQVGEIWGDGHGEALITGKTLGGQGEGPRYSGMELPLNGGSIAEYFNPEFWGVWEYKRTAQL